MIPLEDRFPPGVVDEHREHLTRWSGGYRGAGSRSESGWWPVEDDEGEAIGPRRKRASNEH